MSLIAQIRNQPEYMMHQIYADKVYNNESADIKAIDVLAQEISNRFCPTIPSERFESILLAEVHNKINQVVEEIDEFLASGPVNRKEVREFRSLTLHPALAYVLHEWAADNDAFEAAIILEIISAMKENGSMRMLGQENGIELHNIIYPKFVQPLYNRILAIWRESIDQDDRLLTPISDLLDGIQVARDKLTGLLSDIDRKEPRITH